jgi:hypothetical protein
MLKPYNLRIDQVMIQSKLKSSFGAKNPGLQRPGFMVEPGPNANVKVVLVVKPLRWFSFGSNCNPEPL